MPSLCSAFVTLEVIVIVALTHPSHYRNRRCPLPTDNLCQPGRQGMSVSLLCRRTTARGARPSSEVVLLDVIAKRPEAHAEQFGGLHLHTTSTLQRLRDVAALNLLDVRFEVESPVG